MAGRVPCPRLREHVRGRPHRACPGWPNMPTKTWAWHPGLDPGAAVREGAVPRSDRAALLGPAAVFGRATETVPRLRQVRADGVLGDAEFLADLAVVQEFQVVEPDDLGLAFGQVFEHLLDFLARGDRLGPAGG